MILPQFLLELPKVLTLSLHSIYESHFIGTSKGLMKEIQRKEKDLEILNGLQMRVESETIDTNTTRNRFNRGSFGTFTDNSF